MVKIDFSKSAEKSFLKLKLSDQKKISKALEKLIRSPLSGEKLKGDYEGLYRMRAWPYRVIYSYDSKSESLEIVTIDHRQGVYR